MDIYRQKMSHSSHPSCCGDVLRPKALFSSAGLLVLSACSAVGVWYHEECRSKFGLKGPDTTMYQWRGCRFVKSLPDSFNQQSCKLHKRDIWQHRAGLCVNKRPMQTTMLARSLSRSHTYPHRHYEPTADHRIIAGMYQIAAVDLNLHSFKLAQNSESLINYIYTEFSINEPHFQY